MGSRELCPNFERFPFAGIQEPFATSSVNAVEPSSLLKWVFIKLWSERRFTTTVSQDIKVPYQYMSNHYESVYQHLELLQARITKLQEDIPNLNKYVDVVFMRQLAWLHEVDETIDGDRSYEDQYDTDGIRAAVEHTDQTFTTHFLKIQPVMELIFPNEKERIKWSKDVSFVDNTSNLDRSDDHAIEICLLRLLDVFTGGDTVINHSNNLEKHVWKQQILIQERLNSLTSKLVDLGIKKAFMRRLEKKLIEPHVQDLNKVGIKVKYKSAINARQKKVKN